MPILPIGEAGRWTNYHGTGVCEDATRFALRSGDAVRGRDEIAIAAAAVQDWLAAALAAGKLALRARSADPRSGAPRDAAQRGA